jgi:uncharacterized sulfatase
MPKDRVYDGYDLTPTLFGSGGKHPREVFYYYRDTSVYAVRQGAYKAHFITQGDHADQDVVYCTPPLLYNLDADPSESNNISRGNTNIINNMRDLLKKHESSIVKVQNQLSIK